MSETSDAVAEPGRPLPSDPCARCASNMDRFTHRLDRCPDISALTLDVEGRVERMEFHDRRRGR